MSFIKINFLWKMFLILKYVWTKLCLVPWQITTDACTIIGIFSCQSAIKWSTALEVEGLRDRGAVLRQRFPWEAFTDTCCCKPSGQRIKCEFFIHSWETSFKKVASLKSLQLYLRANRVNDLRCCINVISDQSATGVCVLQESSSKALQSFLLLCYR